MRDPHALTRFERHPPTLGPRRARTGVLALVIPRGGIILSVYLPAAFRRTRSRLPSPVTAQETVAPSRPLRTADERPRVRNSRPVLTPGASLGRYTVVKRLGAPGEGGGQGAVYLAEDAHGGRFALKVPHRHDPRFERELAAAKAVQSRRVARVWDYDLSVPFIAYEHIPGTTLSSTLDAGDLADGDLPRLFAQVAAGLADIHAVSTGEIPALSHGDLTLDNIMVTPGGEAVIVDLGAVGTGAGNTISRNVIGKPGYWAPEQMEGPARGAATDVWQLGICMARAGTGHMPFPYENAMAAREQTPNVDGLPVSLADAVARCLIKDPERRPSASEVAEMVQHGNHEVAPRADGIDQFRGHRPYVRRVIGIRFDVDRLGVLRRSAILASADEQVRPVRIVLRNSVAVGDYAIPAPGTSRVAAHVPTTFQHHERQHVATPDLCPSCATVLLPVEGNWRVYAPSRSRSMWVIFGQPEPAYCPNADSCPDQVRLRLQHAFKFRFGAGLLAASPTAAWPEDVLDPGAPQPDADADEGRSRGNRIDDLARRAWSDVTALLSLYDSPVKEPRGLRQEATEVAPTFTLADVASGALPYSGLEPELQAAAGGWWAERGDHVRAGARALLTRLPESPGT